MTHDETSIKASNIEQAKCGKLSFQSQICLTFCEQCIPNNALCVLTKQLKGGPLVAALSALGGPPPT